MTGTIDPITSHPFYLSLSIIRKFDPSGVPPYCCSHTSKFPADQNIQQSGPRLVARKSSTSTPIEYLPSIKQPWLGRAYLLCPQQPPVARTTPLLIWSDHVITHPSNTKTKSGKGGAVQRVSFTALSYEYYYTTDLHQHTAANPAVRCTRHHLLRNRVRSQTISQQPINIITYAIITYARWEVGFSRKKKCPQLRASTRLSAHQLPVINKEGCLAFPPPSLAFKPWIYVADRCICEDIPAKQLVIPYQQDEIIQKY